jgi:hypothetical protein
VEALEADMQTEATHREGMLGSLGALRDLIGSPGEKADGSEATGLYDLIHSLGKRVGKFERLWYQALGAFKVGVPILAASGAVIWFLEGAKITKLLHG